MTRSGRAPGAPDPIRSPHECTCAPSADLESPITDQRVTLRELHPCDSDAIFIACQDPLIQQFTPVPVPYRLEHAVQFIEQQRSSCWCVGHSLAVTDPPTDTLIGCIAGRRVGQAVVVGYWTAPRWRRAGRTSAALRLLSDRLLTEAGAKSIDLDIEPGNVASIRTAERAGFRLRPGDRPVVAIRGRAVAAVSYRRLVSELEGKRAAPP